jgi:predicted aldo/keto reductase-like oxidoreductase
MRTRRFGRTGHESTLAIFGAAAFYEISQEQADRTMELVIRSGINHIDVAPSYGQAEQRLAPWLAADRQRFFLGCKTTERARLGAHNELRRSLEHLQVSNFDLYQFHAVGSMEELDQITQPGGALEAVIKARDEGLVRYIGITGHGLDVPKVFLEALRRFDFDSVLFPLNFILYANLGYRRQAEQLLAPCKSRDIGVMIIKSIARGPWGDKPRKNTTWYEPFSDPVWIQRSIAFALSQPVTGICTPGDVTLLPLVLEACENFSPYSEGEQEATIARAGEFESLFT